MQILSEWFQRNLSNRQVIILLTLLALGLIIVLAFGAMLIPLFASLVIAYLLEWPVQRISRLHVPRLAAIIIVFAAFLTVLFLGFFWLVPLLINQVTQLIQQLPLMISETQQILMQLPELYPRFITEDYIREIVAVMKSEIGRQAQHLLSFSLSSVLGLFTLLVYLILLPILVFFFLKDKERILNWIKGFLPQERTLASQVWQEVNWQIGNYVRGKFLEILIVWSASFVTFSFLGLNYALLLGLLVGLSVLIPYVGAAVATLPVALVAFFQWGTSSEFLYALLAYAVIQLLDGNLLVTLLLSEAVNLHPIAIIAAVLLFGGLWGFWGIFFAIPLATLINAVIKAWPREQLAQQAQAQE